MLADANDTSVRIDEFGYLYEVSDSDRTEDSDECCDEVDFGSETPDPDVIVCAKSSDVQNAPECETQNGSGAFCRETINLQEASCEEEYSQRPHRNL